MSDLFEKKDFKNGDRIVCLRDMGPYTKGDIAYVNYMPGSEEYDQCPFSRAEYGMLVGKEITQNMDDLGWEFQEDWELAKS